MFMVCCFTFGQYFVCLLSVCCIVVFQDLSVMAPSLLTDQTWSLAMAPKGIQ